ncbi:unnamed protein product [Rotaria sp. Silwood2]|nr:unnamed protein product [Rotaria sp. Silwood2]CAF2973567.1 unnamed protein product [Rotaria sp. Silwood2]CAF3057574.1 unnamed protein product [Rotaria sp. Silwood2]CAF4090284.1 unnamed protein product [Rotaria sp. Silwood2]CAF4311508.1 unnamed protein product [Rotaria sp. Silwood2]
MSRRPLDSPAQHISQKTTGGYGHTINQQLPISNIYRNSYEVLNDSHVDTYYNSTLMQRSTNNVTSDLRKHAQPINSPLRRPHSSSNDDLSETENFLKDPNTKTVRTYKRSRLITNKLHQNQQQQQTTASNYIAPANDTYRTTINEHMTIEAERFAQSRYPFPPFIIRFSTPNMKEQSVAEDLRKQLKEHCQREIDFVGYRSSKTKCNINEIDILLFVKDSYSFACLFDDSNWPALINGQTFSRPSKPSIPPQLSILIKNVGLHIDLTQFSNELRSSYSDIVNVIRMKNKNLQDIKLIKVEFSKPEQRNDILSKRKILIESLSYEVDEYLAQAQVLICSKCLAIGHFRKQCRQVEERCKVCGDKCPDLKQHSCSNNLHCIHCNGNHQSNDMKCPVVKEFRANLTSRLLSIPPYPNNKNNNNIHFRLNQADFPILPDAQRSTIYGYKSNTHVINNDILFSKFDELNLNIHKTNESLMKLSSSNDKFEKFMTNMIERSKKVEKNVEDLQTTGLTMRTDVTQLQVYSNRHENLFTKVLLPMMNDLASFVLSMNREKYGKLIDADFGVKLERLRAQLNNALEGKTFC